METIRAFFARLRNRDRRTLSRFVVHYQPMANKFLLQRKIFTDNSTVGELYLEGSKICDTLEDTCRNKKIYSKTAIPAGSYEVVVNFSKRFNKYLPLLLNVKGFRGVRIHSGNTPDHTSGCILVGRYNKERPDFIGHSRVTFTEFMPKLEALMKKEKVTLDIHGGISERDFKV